MTSSLDDQWPFSLHLFLLETEWKILIHLYLLFPSLSFFLIVAPIIYLTCSVLVLPFLSLSLLSNQQLPLYTVDFPLQSYFIYKKLYVKHSHETQMFLQVRLPAGLFHLFLALASNNRLHLCNLSLILFFILAHILPLFLYIINLTFFPLSLANDSLSLYEATCFTW